MSEETKIDRSYLEDEEFKIIQKSEFIFNENHSKYTVSLDIICKYDSINLFKMRIPKKYLWYEINKKYLHNRYKCTLFQLSALCVSKKIFKYLSKLFVNKLYNIKNLNFFIFSCCVFGFAALSKIIQLSQKSCKINLFELLTNAVKKHMSVDIVVGPSNLYIEEYIGYDNSIIIDLITKEIFKKYSIDNIKTYIKNNTMFPNSNLPLQRKLDLMDDRVVY